MDMPIQNPKVQAGPAMFERGDLAQYLQQTTHGSVLFREFPEKLLSFGFPLRLPKHTRIVCPRGIFVRLQVSTQVRPGGMDSRFMRVRQACRACRGTWQGHCSMHHAHNSVKALTPHHNGNLPGVLCWNSLHFKMSNA